MIITEDLPPSQTTGQLIKACTNVSLHLPTFSNTYKDKVSIDKSSEIIGQFFKGKASTDWIDSCSCNAYVLKDEVLGDKIPRCATRRARNRRRPVLRTAVLSIRNVSASEDSSWAIPSRPRHSAVGCFSNDWLSSFFHARVLLGTCCNLLFTCDTGIARRVVRFVQSPCYIRTLSWMVS